jgi:hypothetical protein
MIGTEYTMMLEAFMETAKSQNQELVDGAVFVFVPQGGDANEATILSWISDHCERSDGLVWHDVFVAMLWTLLKSGVEGDVLRAMVEYAIKKQDLIDTSDVSEFFGEGELN